VAIDPGWTWGSWEGWGTSLCWWAQAFGDRDDLADTLFTARDQVSVAGSGQTLPGLGLNIARYNAGACSWNSINGETMVASPNIPRSRQIEGYWLNWFSDDPSSDSWNWNADAKQRAMLRKARDRGANRFELFSNSPMWWMCDNHNPSGNTGGLANSAGDNLQSWNYRQHAVYLATIARYAQDHWGIDFVSVEPCNEPSSHWWTSTNNQEGCYMGTGTQSAVITNLRAELDSRGLTKTMVSASDENTYDLATSTWNAFDDATRDAVGRINVHGYQYGGGRRDLLAGLATQAGSSGPGSRRTPCRHSRWITSFHKE